jgi:GNAT superfamily N-acetyltransferase
MDDVEIRINPSIPRGELYDFYERNNICEAGYGPELAEVVLQHPCVTVGAFCDGELIGFGRALFDGLSATIVEFSLDLRFQDVNELQNGCFVDSDPHGIAKRMAEALLTQLRRLGCYFFSIGVWSAGEQRFYGSLGFRENTGAKEFVIDERPYVKEGNRTDIYTPERIAEFLLNNAVNAEDYARAVEEVRRLGLDPEAIPHERPKE